MSRWRIGPTGRMVVGNNSVTFDRVPESANNVRILGSLVFDLRKSLGNKAYLDLTAVTKYRLMARDFIAALYEHSSPGRIGSDYTIGSYGGLIREFLDYCSAIALPDDFRMRDIGHEFLLDYRTHLRQTKLELKSEGLRKRFGNLERLIQAGQVIGLVHPDLQLPRNFRQVGDSDGIQPYPSGEALDIEDACRRHIRELLARLEKGQQLLAEGRNPKGIKAAQDPRTGRILPQKPEARAWNQLSNLLWYVVNCMNGRCLKRDELLAGGHSSFNNSLMGVYQGAYRKVDVYSHLYPLAVDLIPFIILLAKSTGRNECSIFDLKRDCLQEREGRYFLSYVKRRGGAVLYAKPVANDGPYSPVALIRLLLKITDPLVPLADPEDKSRLFLGLTVHPNEQNPVKSLDPAYVKFQMNGDGGWCELNELVDQHKKPLRISLRRLRTYYLSKRYKKHGQLSKVSRDAAHSLANTTVGYVNNESTKHIHEQAIEDGIQSALKLARPVVLTDNSVEKAARTIGVSESVAEGILRGEQDVFFSSCKDFYNRPGGQKNKRCDKPWNCLQSCSNAIITRHVLPRVMAFMEFLLEQRAELKSEDWAQKFGEVWQVITTDILPKFSSDAIAEAKRYAAEGALYIPLALKV